MVGSISNLQDTLLNIEIMPLVLSSLLESYNNSVKLGL